MAKKQKFYIMKEALKKELPNGFKIEVSKTGLTVKLFYKGELSHEEANRLVKKAAKKFKLSYVGGGIFLKTNEYDWEYIDTTIDALMANDAKVVYKALKDFFKKWNGNEYVNSDKAYKWIDKTRNMVETDEA